MARPETRRLGKYVVVERVAEGPLTEVLKARLDGIAGFSRNFAIKRVRAEIARHPDILARVEVHVREAAALSHGNIAQLLDFGRDGGVPYVVLEWVDGWSLARLLARAAEASVTMPVGHAAWVGLQMLKALEYAHHRELTRDGQLVLGLVHGAVTPENVLVSRSGEVRLTDFGLARAADEVAVLDPTLLPARPDRLAPEARTGHAVLASDLWGVARVVRTCLVGVGKDDGRPLRDLRADVPEPLAAAITAALSDDPDARPSGATEMKDAFSDLLHDLGDVFTQATLARWIVDTLGEPAVPSLGLPDLDMEEEDDRTDENIGEAPSLETESTSPVSGDEHLVLDDDARTQVAGKPVLPPPRPPVAPAPPAPSAPLSADAPTPLSPIEPAWDDAGATVVNPDLVAKLAELRDQKAAGFEAEERTRLRTTPLGLDLADDVPAAEPAVAWRGGLVAGVAMLLVGVVLGAVGTFAASRNGSITVNPPLLDVRTAPDVQMQVTVDGVAIRGPTQLTPGAHQVRVDVVGAAPWLVDLTLQAGEYRLMMVEADRIPVSTTPEAPPAAGAATP